MRRWRMEAVNIDSCSRRYRVGRRFVIATSCFGKRLQRLMKCRLTRRRLRSDWGKVKAAGGTRMTYSDTSMSVSKATKLWWISITWKKAMSRYELTWERKGDDVGFKESRVSFDYGNSGVCWQDTSSATDIGWSWIGRILLIERFELLLVRDKQDSDWLAKDKHG